MSAKSVAKGFDFLATFYDLLLRITIGFWIKKTQTVHFSSIGNAQSILIYGGGTGWILDHLQLYKSITRVVYVDLSPKMICEAKKRVVSEKMDIEFIEGDHANVPEELFDVIITPFVLDCIPEYELPKVISSLKKKLKDQGVWLFSDFHTSQNKINNWFVLFLYGFFNIVCKLNITSLPNFDACFSEAGLKIAKQSFVLNQLMGSKVLIKDNE